MGFKKIGVEFKMTMTPGKEHARVLRKERKRIDLDEIYLLNSSATEIILDDNLKLLPWWQFRSVIKI